jgi:hypothetical protein
VAFAISSAASTLLGLALRLSGVGGADVVDGQPDEDPLLVDHGAPVVVPVGVLTGDATVVVDQPFHGLRQGHEFGGAVDLDPGAEEVVGEDAQGGGGGRRKLRTL